MNGQAKSLWFALVGMAVGAAMLHLRIHPPSQGMPFRFANAIILLDLVGVSLLFLSRRTAAYAVLLNGFIAFFGMILMADFSIAAALAGKARVSPADSLFGWLMVTTLPDITIAFADFLVGTALYRAMTGGGGRAA